MDDTLIATSTSLQDHRDATHDVLDLLQEHDLFLKKKKCRWEVDSIDYLGLILEKGVTRMDPTKVEGIKNWPRPTKVKDVRSFLGFATFTDHSYQVSPKLRNPSTNLRTKMSLLYGKTSTKLRSTPCETWSPVNLYYDNHS